MPLSPDRLAEYIAALKRLRSETTKRVASFTFGHRRVFDKGKDMTDILVESMRREIAQLDWIIEQLQKGHDAQKAKRRTSRASTKSIKQTGTERSVGRKS